jgi:hypothetical protein
MKKQISISNEEDMSNLVRIGVAGIVGAIITSVSTHNLQQAAGLTPDVHDTSHIAEHQREVVHGHANVGRNRFNTVTGNS